MGLAFQLAKLKKEHDYTLSDKLSVENIPLLHKSAFPKKVEVNSAENLSLKLCKHEKCLQEDLSVTF